jgi:tetraacyldisaccharide 4'-kinase
MLAFAGIGKPGFFFEGLQQLGVRLAGPIAFPDHHRYTREDYQRILARCRELKLNLVATTEKDAMRLDVSQLPGLRVAVIKMELEFLEPVQVSLLLDSLARHETI